MYDWGMTDQTITLMKTEGSSKTEGQLRTHIELEINTVCEKSEREDSFYNRWWCKNHP